MISSGGSQSSDFDVLNSQRGDGDSAVHVIKINKKIGDVKFPKIIQPTELTPDVVVTPEDKEDEEETPQIQKYSAPKELLDYLDNLIIKRKLPLRTLKFDIEFSKSKEEVAQHLEDHVKKVGNIERPDVDELFRILGVDEKTLEVDSGENAGVENENPKNILDIQGSLNTLAQQLTHETIPGQILDIKTLRDHYASLKIEYLKKVREDSRVYRIMMSQLGASRPLPERPEPTELIEARGEYFAIRKKMDLETEDSIRESAAFVESEFPNFSIKYQERLKKALASFDTYINITQVSESIMNADVKSIEKIIDPEQFDGMRVAPESELQESHEAQSVIDVRKPELDAALVPSEKLLSMDIKTVDDKKKEPDITEKYKTEDVKIEVMGASGINFLPKKELPVFVVHDTHPKKNKKNNAEQNISDLSQKKDDSVTEVPPATSNMVEEDKKIEETAENIVKQDAKVENPTEIPPVDSTVAVMPLTAQNVFPTEFEDKRLEVHHDFPGKPNEIRVYYDGKEIAKGEVGGKVTINKEFKSGFLLADTIEERALKHAHKIIKTLKPQKLKK